MMNKQTLFPALKELGSAIKNFKYWSNLEKSTAFVAGAILAYFVIDAFFLN